MLESETQSPKNNNPLRILFFSHSSELAGAERSLLELIKQLKTNHKMVCTVVLPSDGPLRLKLNDIGASTLIIRYRWWCEKGTLSNDEKQANIISSFNVINKNLNKFIQINPDIILTNTLVIPWGALTAGLLDKPHIWFIREFGEMDHHLKFYLPFKDILQIIKDSSNLVLVNSKAVGDILFDKNPPDNMQVIYPYVEVPLSSMEDNTKYFCRTGSTKLIILGNISEGKGQEDAILAIKELTEKNLEIELLILGSGNPSYVEFLKKIVRENNIYQNVIFKNFIKNPYVAIKQADIVLVCSRNEAFGRTILEAMLLKKPVIGTNSGGVPEIIKEGYNGFLYEPRDYKQLALKIEYFIKQKDKLLVFGENGYKFAKENFTKDTSGGKLARLLKDFRGSQPKTPYILNHFIGQSGIITQYDLATKLQVKDKQINNSNTQTNQRQSRERNLYKLFLVGIKVIRSEGWNSFFKKVNIFLWPHKFSIKDELIRTLRYFKRHGFRETISAVRFELKKARSSDYKSENEEPKFELGQAMAYFKKDLNVEEINEEIDIIIPIYNGMQYLTKLFDSLIKNTDSPYRLILIDDCSTDPDVFPFLERIVADCPSSILIRNQENKGFVWSVNAASNYIKNHFVILNTDVEVPRGWLHRLMLPIINNGKIASTTPFTNAGTICSFPYMNKNNEIFNNLSIDEVDSYFKDIDQKSITIEIPTGVGFCMGINSNAWRTVGQFNYNLFNQGYGEENDWCMRARTMGYQNIMVTNLFIYHKHSGTFGTELREKLTNKNNKIVQYLHPTYKSLINDFIKHDPAEILRQFILLLLIARQSQGGKLIVGNSFNSISNNGSKNIFGSYTNGHETLLNLNSSRTKSKMKLTCLYKDYKIEFLISNLDEIDILIKWINCKEIIIKDIASFNENQEILRAVNRWKKEYLKCE